MAQDDSNDTSEENRLARILTRAAQMQEVRDDGEISLTMLEEAAEEVGIDRALVRRAAWEQGSAVSQPPRVLGLPTKVVRRRWIDTTLGPAEIKRLMTRLDAFFGSKGDRTIDTDSATWSARHVHVTFEGQRDGTLVQISERFVNTANSMTVAGAMFGLMAGLTIMITMLAALGKGLLFASVAIPVVLASTAVGVWLARRRVGGQVALAGESFEQALRSLDQAAPRALESGEPDDD